MGIVPMTKASAVREMSMTIAAIAIGVVSIAAAAAVAVAIATCVIAIASMAVEGVSVGEVWAVRVGHVGVRVIIMTTWRRPIPKKSAQKSSESLEPQKLIDPYVHMRKNIRTKVPDIEY